MPTGDISISRIDILSAGKVINLMMTVPATEDQVVVVAEITSPIYGPI